MRTAKSAIKEILYNSLKDVSKKRKKQAVRKIVKELELKNTKVWSKEDNYPTKCRYWNSKQCTKEHPLCAIPAYTDFCPMYKKEPDK